MAAINNRIREIRHSRRLTQAQLARLARVGMQTVSDIENKSHIPRLDVALLVADALGVSAEELFWVDFPATEVEHKTRKRRPTMFVEFAEGLGQT